MRLIDKELEATHVVEERREAFEDFVKAKKEKGEAATGRKPMALHNMGFRDSYGPVEYSRGIHNGKWILPDAKNGKVLIFTKKKDAMTYGKSILDVLKRNGFSGSKVWVDEVAVMKTSSFAFMPSLAPKVSYDEENRYVLRIEVR